jgi:DNA modification methylase
MISRQIGSCTLINADSVECIRDNLEFEFDSVITDPPYGIEDMVGGYSRAGETIENDKNLDVTMQALKLCAEARSGIDMLFAVFYSARITPAFYAELSEAIGGDVDYYGEMIWDKRMPGMGKGIRYSHENVSVWKTPGRAIDSVMSVTAAPRIAELHPHQKPVSVMSDIIRMAKPRAVIDPFMGSGSTAVACYLLNVPFVGIELDHQRYTVALDRLTHESSQAIFNAPTDQVGLF